MRAVLGVDIGTTNIKAVVFGLDGSVLGIGRVELEDISPAPGTSEHRLEDLWQGFVATVRTAVRSAGMGPGAVIGIGFSTYLGGFAALDSEGVPITPNMLTWKDKRALKYRDSALGGLSEEELRHRTGQGVTGSLAVPRLRWFKEHEHAKSSRIDKLILCAKQYIIYRLLNSHHLDWECARSTGLFNMQVHDWQRDQFEVWGISETMLPLLRKCHDVVGRVPHKEAEVLGLDPGTPVVIGGGDGLMSTVGSGVIAAGSAAASIGTVAVVRAFRNQFVLTKNPLVDCKILPDVGYLNSAITPTGGLALKWFRDKLGFLEKVVADETGEEAFTLIDRMAAASPPGCNGLLFVPPEPGEIAFRGQGHLIGSFIGVTEAHSRKDFARAIMEGIAYLLLRESLMLREEGHEEFTRIRLGGGAADPHCGVRSLPTPLGCLLRQ